VLAALNRRRALQGANAQRVREAILSGQANTPTTGAAIGQINGLGIYEFHPSEGNFAVPTRISATVSPGRDARLLDIEREAEQADADHVRGEMTIEGYLAQRYGQERPLRLVARVRFEQEHGTTGGDSASGALLYALLSALARVPLRYSCAVTGAVGQHGELQPIGGVNTKIEGFWELCRLRRAQGEQAEHGYATIIPAVNARDLMLRDEVAASIANEGWFRVWPVSTVDEALTILTGLPAAQIHARVEQRLQQFHNAAFQAPGGR
jgi:predicted ATP-dependent protease